MKLSHSQYICLSKGRMVVARAGGREGKGVESYCLMSTEFQFGKMKNGLDIDDGDDCTIM